MGGWVGGFGIDPIRFFIIGCKLLTKQFLLTI